MRETGGRGVGGGFTLVELLVVVAILSLLVMILVPSLNRVKYLTQLTVCASNVRQLCAGATMYASGNRQRYPNRQALNVGWKPTDIKVGWYDERVSLQPYLPTLDVFLDPTSPPVPLAGSLANCVESSYGLWYGWGYYTSPASPENMNVVLGRGFVYTNRRYHVLASDWLTMVYYIPGIEGSHPDRERILRQAIWNGSDFCISRWQVWWWPQMRCGNLDFNFGYDDGSVRRLMELQIPGDTRLVEVPEFTGGGMGSTAYVPVPGN